MSDKTETFEAQTAGDVVGDAPSLGRSLLVGGVGFGVASLCVFATVAYAERWMYQRLGGGGAYAAWTALFILLGGAALGVLVKGRWRLPKFYLLFGAAFFAYAVGWIGPYFALGGRTGEWVGAVACSLLMALVLAAGFGAGGAWWRLAAVIFAGHTVGYFGGSLLNDALAGSKGMLAWGALYGPCLGAGLGAALHLAQRRSDRKS